MTVNWVVDPEEHDYPAAADYLALLTGPAQVEEFVSDLKAAPIVVRRAKDIPHAARISLLPVGQSAIRVQSRQDGKRKPLSPILLIRGDLAAGVQLPVADGYCPVCASYPHRRKH